jgi:hypothetical protein
LPSSGNGSLPFVCVANAISKFVWTVDAWLAVKISREYLGHMIYNPFTRLIFKVNEEAPISVLASLMCKNLKNDVREYSVCSLVTLLANTPDKTTIMYKGDMDRELDVLNFNGLSGMYSIGFGVWASRNC